MFGIIVIVIITCFVVIAIIFTFGSQLFSLAIAHGCFFGFVRFLVEIIEQQVEKDCIW